jgi:hypothetical protein
MDAMHTLAEVVASRREWIDSVLKTWCRGASRSELLAAEQEWADLAGRADPNKTLWPWAWSRFSALYVEGLAGIDESYAVEVALRDGSRHAGYPDARRSQRGQLWLVSIGDDGLSREAGPFSIDDVVVVERR